MSMDDVEPAAVYGSAVPSCDDIAVDDFDFLPNSLHATGGGGCSFPSSSFRSILVSSFPKGSSHHYAVNFHDTPVAVAPCGMSTSASAFRRYERHLGPRRRLTKPACGQRMFKTAMSVLDKMHTAIRYNQLQQQQQASGNQLQHMISERKSREKLNGSFHALRTVLPPGSKKDKTSTLIIAREYVNSLKSQVCELEEKNQALQAQLARQPTSGAVAEEEEAELGEKVEIQITAAEGDQRGRRTWCSGPCSA